jgi:hypothetical protein
MPRDFIFFTVSVLAVSSRAATSVGRSIGLRDQECVKIEPIPLDIL